VTLQKREGISVATTSEFLAVPKYNEKLRNAAAEQSSRDDGKLIFT